MCFLWIAYGQVRTPEQGWVTGNALDAHGRPAGKAPASLTSLNLGPGAEGETDGQGHFQIEAAPQSYVICAKTSRVAPIEFGSIEEKPCEYL
jgi:hypothetical protein